MIYMINHYIYDGYRTDEENVIPCSTLEKAIDYINRLSLTHVNYELGKDKEGLPMLEQRGPGRYGYDQYYIYPMALNEEL